MHLIGLEVGDWFSWRNDYWEIMFIRENCEYVCECAYSTVYADDGQFWMKNPRRRVFRPGAIVRGIQGGPPAFMKKDSWRLTCMVAPADEWDVMEASSLGG